MTKEEQEAQEQATKDASEAAQEKRFAEIANRAAADHAKRTAAKYDKQLEVADARVLTLQAQLDELRAGTAPKPEAKPEADAYRKEMDARMAAYEKERAIEREATKKLQDEARAAEERSATLDALKAVGLEGAPAAAAHLLLKDEGRIGRDEAGQLVFLVKKDGFTDKVSIHDGVKGWADTDAGKAFLPPKGVGGSGNTGGAQKGRQGAKPVTRAERVAEARAALAASFMGGGDS